VRNDDSGGRRTGWPDPVINPNDITFLPPRGVNVNHPSPQLKAAKHACHWPPAP
jgi:hypothetical protein